MQNERGDLLLVHCEGFYEDFECSSLAFGKIWKWESYQWYKAKRMINSKQALKSELLHRKKM